MWREEVRKWLEREERDQAHLARKAGLSESYMSNLMTGKHTPSLEALRRLERAMGMEFGDLMRLLEAGSDAARPCLDQRREQPEEERP